MLFSVNTNNNSLLAQKALMRTNVGLNKSVAKLSSGQRINDSADDAAGLGIAERLKDRINGYREAQSERNANNGISVQQKAEGAANEVANIVKRMRELAIQSASETLATDEQGYSGESNEPGAFLSPSAIRSLQVQIPSVPLTPDVASRSVDLARNGIVENPRVALEAQANQSPERMVYLLG
jgi:flagellin-like hook-associated protein FlgL